MSEKKAIVGPGLMQKHLKTLSTVISPRVVLPVLSYIKMSFNKQKLTLTATNLNHFITIETNGENKNPFDVLIPYAVFKDVCDKVDSPITIVVDDKSITFNYLNGKNKILNQAAVEEFPVIPVDEFHTTVQVDGDFFYSLSTADVCRAKEDALTHMCNPALDFTKGNVRPAGMSQAIGFYKDFPTETKYVGVHMVTPEFVAITREFQQTDVSIGASFVKATYKDITVVSKMSANPFVNYRSFLPEPTAPVYNLSVDRKDLIKALGVVTISMDKSTNRVLFFFEENDLILKASNDMEESEGEDKIKADNKGVPIECINLAGQYLLTILNRMQSERVKFAITAANKQVYVQPDDETNSIYYIQPLAFNN